MYASDLQHSSPTLEGKLARLYTLHGGNPIELSFRTVYLDLLAAFGNPHVKLPPVIHVAGTNGKGSIIATLRAILEAEGYRVHVYTSPHLCAFNERIRLAGKLIDDAGLEALIDEALDLNGANTVTFFEITTAMAFAAFARTPADILLLEVGLGGRMDCTNIIEKPLVSVIGSIGYDHMEFLGDAIEKIAAEKAGIIKQGAPCVISRQNTQSDNILKTIKNIADQKGAPLARHGAEWFTQENSNVFKFVHKDVEMILPRPNLQGTHQIPNAGAALAALKLIENQFPVSRAAIETGLRNIDWPGRLQNMTRHFENIPPDWEIWLDGGHNDDAAKALAMQARQWNAEDEKPLHLVLGMMNRKDPASFASILKDHVKSITCIDIPDEPQAHKAEKMEKLVKARLLDCPVKRAGDFHAAIESITRGNLQPGRILIAGSLYLAGDVLKSAAIQP